MDREVKAGIDVGYAFSSEPAVIYLHDRPCGPRYEYPDARAIVAQGWIRSKTQ